jgi:hypothetical protein
MIFIISMIIVSALVIHVTNNAVVTNKNKVHSQEAILEFSTRIMDSFSIPRQ